MISSLIKRIQKTIRPGKALSGDELDNFIFETMNPTASKPIEPPKAEPKPAADLKLDPTPPKPAPKPIPKPEAVLPVSLSDIRTAMLLAEAKKWLNIKETGPNKGPEVERFQKAVDGKASCESWCAAFVMYCIFETEKQYKSRFNVDLKTWLYKTEHVLTMWNLSPKECRLTAPIPGSLIIWQHLDAAGNQTAKGHVGIVSRVIDKTFAETIEGNTSNDAVVQDDGDGVYLLKRNYKQVTGTKRVVGFLLPWKG